MIYGKTDVQNVGTAATSITTNAASSGKVLKINMLLVSNIDGANPVDVDVVLRRSSSDYYITKAVSVPADSSLVVIGKENPMYLMENDSIRLTAGAVDSAQAVCSYEEIG
jgi:hypothetical protein